MSVHDRIRQAVVNAIGDRRHRGGLTDCKTCRGMALVIQVSPEMHDAWVVEARALTRRPVHTITHYEGIPVRQLPNLAEGTAQVVTCWDCCELPTIPDDPDAIARFLT